MSGMQPQPSLYHVTVMPIPPPGAPSDGPPDRPHLLVFHDLHSFTVMARLLACNRIPYYSWAGGRVWEMRLTEMSWIRLCLNTPLHHGIGDVEDYDTDREKFSITLDGDCARQWRRIQRLAGYEAAELEYLYWLLSVAEQMLGDLEQTENRIPALFGGTIDDSNVISYEPMYGLVEKPVLSQNASPHAVASPQQRSDVGILPLAAQFDGHNAFVTLRNVESEHRVPQLAHQSQGGGQHRYGYIPQRLPKPPGSVHLCADHHEGTACVASSAHASPDNVQAGAKMMYTVPFEPNDVLDMTKSTLSNAKIIVNRTHISDSVMVAATHLKLDEDEAMDMTMHTLSKMNSELKRGDFGAWSSSVAGKLDESAPIDMTMYTLSHAQTNWAIEELDIPMGDKATAVGISSEVYSQNLGELAQGHNNVSIFLPSIKKTQLDNEAAMNVVMYFSHMVAAPPFDTQSEYTIERSQPEGEAEGLNGIIDRENWPLQTPNDAVAAKEPTPVCRYSLPAQARHIDTNSDADLEANFKYLENSMSLGEAVSSLVQFEAQDNASCDSGSASPYLSQIDGNHRLDGTVCNLYLKDQTTRAALVDCEGYQRDAECILTSKCQAQTTNVGPLTPLSSKTSSPVGRVDLVGVSNKCTFTQSSRPSVSDKMVGTNDELDWYTDGASDHCIGAETEQSPILCSLDLPAKVMAAETPPLMVNSCVDFNNTDQVNLVTAEENRQDIRTLLSREVRADTDTATKPLTVPFSCRQKEEEEVMLNVSDIDHVPRDLPIEEHTIGNPVDEYLKSHPNKPERDDQRVGNDVNKPRVKKRKYMGKKCKSENKVIDGLETNKKIRAKSKKKKSHDSEKLNGMAEQGTTQSKKCDKIMNAEEFMTEIGHSVKLVKKKCSKDSNVSESLKITCNPGSSKSNNSAGFMNASETFDQTNEPVNAGGILNVESVNNQYEQIEPMEKEFNNISVSKIWAQSDRVVDNEQKRSGGVFRDETLKNRSKPPKSKRKRSEHETNACEAFNKEDGSALAAENKSDKVSISFKVSNAIEPLKTKKQKVRNDLHGSKVLKERNVVNDVDHIRKTTDQAKIAGPSSNKINEVEKRVRNNFGRKRREQKHAREQTKCSDDMGIKDIPRHMDHPVQNSPSNTVDENRVVVVDGDAKQMKAYKRLQNIENKINCRMVPAVSNLFDIHCEEDNENSITEEKVILKGMLIRGRYVDTVVDCADCGLTLINVHAYRLHRYKMHGDAEPEKTLTCGTCGKGFHTKPGLKVHLSTHTGAMRVVCPRCDRVLANNGSLKVHMHTVHSEGERMPCYICGVELKNGKSLWEHVKMIHAETSNVTCAWPNCGKVFKKKHNLKIHLRIHADEKPIHCDLCEYRCRQQNALNIHKQTKHSVNIKKLVKSDKKDRTEELHST